MAGGLDVFGVEDPPDFPADTALQRLPLSDQVSAAVNWFLHNFEDPVQHMPLEDEGSGFVFIWGGPYGARSEIADRFPFLTDSVIDAAVDKVEHDAIEWAPHDRRVRPVEDDDDEQEDEPGFLRPDIEYLSDAEWRARLSSQVDSLKSAVEKIGIDIAKTGIGHNRPPTAIDDGPITPSDLSFVQEAITDTKADLANPKNPDTSNVHNRAERLMIIANRLGGWLGERASAMVDSALDSEYVHGALIVAASNHYGDLLHALNTVAHTLLGWSSSLLSMF